MSKPRPWDRDEELDMVQQLDKAAAATRQQLIKQKERDAGRANYAAGLLNVWDSSGHLIFNGGIVEPGFPGKRHSEQLIVDWAEKMLKTSKGKLQGATINLVIISQTPVCSTCMGKAQSGLWKEQLQNVIVPETASSINISLWQWGNPNAGQPKYVPVFP